MSDIVDKVKAQVKPQQKFDSKVLAHVESYSLVSFVKEKLLSISLFQILYTQYLIPLYNFVNIHLFSVSPIYDILSFFDLLFNNLLTVFDKYFINIPLDILKSINKSYVQPIDAKLISINNQYLNPIEDKASDDLFKIYKTIFSILYNVKDSVFNKSTELQQNLVNTYNKELSSTKQQNVLGKNIEASYNTGLKTIKSLNDDYITPLKNQTQDYVDQFTSQTRDKTNEFINEAKAKAAPKLDQLKEKDLFNGSPVVSASA